MDVWRLRREEIWSFTSGQMQPLWAASADHIRQSAGSVKPTDIVEHYRQKYDLPEISLVDLAALPVSLRAKALPAHVTMSSGIPHLRSMAAERARSTDGQDRYHIILDSNDRIMRTDLGLVELRHQIEHVKDWIEGFESEVERPVAYDPALGKMRVVSGHHRHFDIFNWEYPHQRAIKNAMANGEHVPEEVLADYP